jgi:uncharacterized membrane protein
LLDIETRKGRSTMDARRPRKGAGWLLLLFLVPFIALLYPPFYNMAQPELIGVPFFYWFQLASIIVTAVITLVAYLARA